MTRDSIDAALRVLVGRRRELVVDVGPTEIRKAGRQ